MRKRGGGRKAADVLLVVVKLSFIDTVCHLCCFSFCLAVPLAQCCLIYLQMNIILIIFGNLVLITFGGFVAGTLCPSFSPLVLF